MGGVTRAMLFEQLALDRAYWTHALVVPFRFVLPVVNSSGPFSFINLVLALVFLGLCPGNAMAPL